MKPHEYYQNREQTYLKHFFLENYLERVAYVVGFTHPEFVFVDGFSGPWRSTDEVFEDTSFMIALQKLQAVTEGLTNAGRNPKIRCVFVEKNAKAYQSLTDVVSKVKRIEIETFHGEFEQKIPEILNYVGNSAFALFFIDPTGWTGYSMNAITPVLRHRGEVLINFMFNDINRFINEHPSEEVQAGFDKLFGTTHWREVISDAPDREKAIVEFYCECLKATGGYSYVTHTRIDHPVKDRSYFYLIYGTRHIKGLQEFKKVEKKFAPEQVRVRLLTKEEKRVNRTLQPSFFGPDLDTLSPLEDEREGQLAFAAKTLEALIQTLNVGATLSCEIVFGTLLAIPLIWESDVTDLLKPNWEKGQIEVIGMPPRGRTVKVEYQLKRLS